MLVRPASCIARAGDDLAGLEDAARRWFGKRARLAA